MGGVVVGGSRRAVVRAREVVLPWVHVWSAAMSVRLQSVHFTRRSSYYSTATKPGPTCSKKGCLNWDGTATGENRLTGLGSQTIDDAWIMRRARGTLYIPCPRQLGTRVTLLDACGRTRRRTHACAEDRTMNPSTYHPFRYHPSVAQLCDTGVQKVGYLFCSVQ